MALADAGTVVAADAETGARAHAERLVTLIERTRSRADWPWSTLDGVVVAVGPGSFTGVRIAVATARALALALDRPALPVTTLDALIEAAPADAAIVVPTIDARRGGLYLTWPAADGRRGAPAVVPLAAAAAAAPAAFTAVGSGAEALVAAAGRGFAVRAAVDAGDVLAAARRSSVAPVPGPAVRALYVRPADAVPQAA